MASKNYEAFLRSLKLVDIRLRGCSSRLYLDDYIQIYRDKSGPMLRIEADYEVEAAEGEFFDTVSRFTLTVEDQKSKLTGLKIQCEFESHFHGKRKADSALVERFKNSGLRVIVWPYFRQFVTDITSRMSIPPLVVPLST
jgi:preprotein translocase subunit SecB